jgi:hypothetical protein
MRENTNVTLTISAPPGPAQEFVLRVVGTKLGQFRNTAIMVMWTDREAQSIIEKLGRASGADFDVVVRPGTGGHILVRVTEVSGGRRGAPPRSRAEEEWWQPDEERIRQRDAESRRRSADEEERRFTEELRRLREEDARRRTQGGR